MEPILTVPSEMMELPHEHKFTLTYRLSIFKKNGPCVGVHLGEMCEVCHERREWRREIGP